MKKLYSNFDKQLFLTETHIHAFYCDLKQSPYHNHDFFEIMYVVSGKATHKTENDVREIAPGDYLVMDYSSFHEYLDGTEDFAVINCLFLSKAIDKTMVECRDFMELFKSYQLRLNNVSVKNTPVNRFFKDESGKVKELLFEMCNECESKQIGYIEYLRCLLLQIIIETLRNNAEPEEIYISPVVKDVIKYIENNYNKHLQLSRIASDMFLSLPYLSAKFKAEVGMCFGDYVKQVRIQKACMLLSTTNLKIKDISEEVGYSDYKRFGSVFKEFTGLSPLKFKNSFNK